MQHRDHRPGRCPGYRAGRLPVIISVARRTIVVGDARKFALNAPIRVCGWDAADLLVTDGVPAGFTGVGVQLAP